MVAVISLAPSLHSLLMVSPKVNKINVFYAFFIAFFGLFTKDSTQKTEIPSARRRVEFEFAQKQKKILISLMPIMILDKLNETSAVSPTYIISVFNLEFGFRLSPGTVYPIFRSLEKEGNIRRLPNRTSGLYVLTAKGKENLEYFKANSRKLFSKLKSEQKGSGSDGTSLHMCEKVLDCWVIP